MARCAMRVQRSGDNRKLGEVSASPEALAGATAGPSRKPASGCWPLRRRCAPQPVWGVDAALPGSLIKETVRK